MQKFVQHGVNTGTHPNVTESNEKKIITPCQQKGIDLNRQQTDQIGSAGNVVVRQTHSNQSRAHRCWIQGV